MSGCKSILPFGLFINVYVYITKQITLLTNIQNRYPTYIDQWVGAAGWEKEYEKDKVFDIYARQCRRTHKGTDNSFSFQIIRRWLDLQQQTRVNIKPCNFLSQENAKWSSNFTLFNKNNTSGEIFAIFLPYLSRDNRGSDDTIYCSVTFVSCRVTMFP